MATTVKTPVSIGGLREGEVRRLIRADEDYRTLFETHYYIRFTNACIVTQRHARLVNGINV